jgi:two-component system OmpR family response regulator
VSPRLPGTKLATILLVEDHEDTREIFQEALEAAGYRVLAVATPAVALQRAEALRIDVVIMDIGIHDEGVRVATRMAALPKAPRVIAVTGRDRRGIPAEEVFVEYLLKPVMPDDLVAVIRRVLGA